MTKKQSSSAMSSLAARVLRNKNPIELLESLDDDTKDMVRRVMEPWVRDARKLAGSVLSQDETPQSETPQSETPQSETPQ